MHFNIYSEFLLGFFVKFKLCDPDMCRISLLFRTYLNIKVSDPSILFSTLLLNKLYLNVMLSWKPLTKVCFELTDLIQFRIYIKAKFEYFDSNLVQVMEIYKVNKLGSY